MADSKAEIANLALAFLKNSKRITNLDTDTSVHADIVRQFYDVRRRKVLRAIPWPFARKFITLALVEENPTAEWLYSYRYPASTIALRRILNDVRTAAPPIPYLEGSDITGKLVYTDRQDAVVEVTADIEDVTIFDEDFVDALRLGLAHDIAPTLAGDDKAGLGVKALAAYDKALLRAAAAAHNEEQPDPPPDSEFIRCR